jgi:hypothetical protein
MARYGQVISRYRELTADLDPERREFPRLFAMRAGLVHGIHHWVRVGIYGLAIATALRGQGRVCAPLLAPEGALEEAVLTACFFHDCARLTEEGEPNHGRAGEKVWDHYARRKELSADLRAIISQALLFHVDHPSVDPVSNEVTICLCNADRLDRVRLGERPLPECMYDDGVWRDLEPLSDRLLQEVRQEKVVRDLERKI